MFKSRGTPETEHLTSSLRLGSRLGWQLEEVALETREGEREGERGERVQGVGGRRGQRGADRVKSPELRCNFVEAERGRDTWGAGRARAAGQTGEGRMCRPAWVVEAPGPRHRRHRGLGQGILLTAALLSAPVPVPAGVHLVWLGAARALNVQLRVRVRVVRIRAPPVSTQARLVVTKSVSLAPATRKYVVK